MCNNHKIPFTCICFFLWLNFFSIPLSDQLNFSKNIPGISLVYADQSANKNEKNPAKTTSEIIEKTGNTMSGNNNKTHLENNGKMPIQDGAMMKKMIESGVALKLFRPQLYPSMTVVHDPTQESLNTFEQLSLKRMLRGYELLSESMNQISMAVTSKDLPKIRKTQEQLRTGYEQLTSGISTYLKLTDKESAHEIGLNWFKQELNIDYSSPFHPQDILWGMDAKRLIMCIIMLSGFILAIIAYAYRMGRVKALFQKISTGDSVKSSPIKSDPVKSDNNITVKIE